MEADRKPVVENSVDDEAERIRDIFKHSFQQTDSELERLIPENFTRTLSERADAANAVPESDFDWSVTLANVETIVDAGNQNRAALRAAEERARIAEAKAQEAVHWLRLLHAAVLKGLPNQT